MNRARKGLLSTIVALGGAMATAGCEPLVTSVGSWQLDSGKSVVESGSGVPETGAGPADVALDVRSAGASFYIEAELGRLDGFSVGDDTTASGGSFLAAPAGLISEDQPGTATARYDLEIANAGDYLIWARFRTRDWQHNRIWAAVDGGAWTKWRSTTGDIWYWYFIHPDLEYHAPVVYQGLSPGRHELVLANCTDGVEIDRLYITSLGEGDRPPGDSSTCQLQPPDAIPMGGKCVPSCGAQVGNTCEPDLCAGRELKEAYDCTICCYVGD